MSTSLSSRILYEDNHLILVNKLPGEIVQADKTGDVTLAANVRHYLKVKYNKPGNVFLGLPHRLDRPTSGIVVFARTDKALSRLSEMFRTGKIEKHYWAITDKALPEEIGELRHFIYRDAQKNKSFAYSPTPDGEKPPVRGVKPADLQEARLGYRRIGESERYILYDINLFTGRHHQIRAQLAACGVHIKGDLKYGCARSNPDGGICLHSHEISFSHPVGGVEVHVIAPPPGDVIWSYFGIQQ